MIYSFAAISIPSFLRSVLISAFMFVSSAAIGQGFGGFDLDPIDEAPPVVVSSEASVTKVRPGDQAVVAVVFEFAEKFHAWPNVPVIPEALGDFPAIPTTVEPVEAAGLEYGRISWPAPKPVEVAFLGDPVDLLVFGGTTVVYVPVRIASDAELGPRSIDIQIGFQACDDTSCLAPEFITQTVSFEITNDATEPTQSDVFGGFDPAVFADPDAWGEGALESVSNDAPKSKFLGLIELPGPGTLGGVLGLAFFAAIGGFVLNLTPCVLPVIPIKVMTISQHAGESRSRALMLGMWMAVGVVAFWLAIGVPVAFIATITDPSIIFGIWWVTLGIGLVILVMGVGIMGVFQIKLPQAVYMVNPKVDSPQGSFMFGVMTAVLGLPCFGFVAGALLAGAATMPAPVVLVIFGAMGVGMALPYLVLAAFPGLVKKLPRTGPASELVKQVMGLLMIAAAAYFIGAGVLALISGAGLSHKLPWWGKAVHWWAIALAMGAAGVWLAVQTIRITKKIGPRVGFSVLALLFVFVGGWAALDRTNHLKHNFWIDYSSELLAESLADGNIVVLDFTAEWCLNCKALEAAILSKEPVRSELIGAGVVPLMADLTTMGAPGWETLRDLGQTGIPLLAVYSPESGPNRPVWLGNTYTSDQVIAAIELARKGAPSEASAMGP
ncbi:MAG: cytochrome c biogenesis protein CcdA [Phycisphaerales bacterium]